MRRNPILAALVGILVLAGCAAPSVGAPEAPDDVFEETLDGPGIEEDEDFGTVEVYDVLTDGSLSPEAEGTALEVWELFQQVASPDFAAEVVLQYRVGDAPESDTLAYVYQDETDPLYWVLAVNLATADDTELLIGTLIHEYAHILALATDQFDEPGTCPYEAELSYGCPAVGSVLGEFYDRFWTAYVDAPEVENIDEDVAYEFYLAHEDDFVSDYAATNVVEDLAESFMTYVMEDSFDGAGVIAAKLAFFDEFPELAAIRERIRADVGL